jgi:hypothetical protein
MTLRIVVEKVDKGGGLWCSVTYRGEILDSDMSEKRLVDWLARHAVDRPEQLLPDLREHKRVDVHEHGYDSLI